MFELHQPMTYVYLLVAVFVIGFAWAFGNWVFAKLVTPRPKT